MKKTALTLAAFSLAAPAYAHEGDHSMSLLANIGHRLSSPTHAFFSVVAGIAVLGLTVAIVKKRA